MSTKMRILVGALVVGALVGTAWALISGRPAPPLGIVPAGAESLSGDPAPVPAAAGGAELSTVNGDRQETSFGDLTADALCGDAGVTIGLVPWASFKPGAIRADSPSRDEIASLLQIPEETWAVSSLTGDQLRRTLERSLSRLPQPNTAFLQVSGLTVVFDASKPKDQRIVSLTSTTGPVQPNQKYEVAMPLMLAQGGSGYMQIFNSDSIVRKGSRGMADVVLTFRTANPGRSYTGQGRLVPRG